MTNDGHVDRHELISSLIDWEVVAQQAPQAWQDALGRVFARLDHNRDGCICMSDIKAHLSAHHVPASSAQQQVRARAYVPLPSLCALLADNVPR